MNNKSTLNDVICEFILYVCNHINKYYQLTSQITSFNSINNKKEKE